MNLHRDATSINIDLKTAMDIEQLLNGGFQPLNSFMNFKDLESVLLDMRLSTGEIWPIPILFSTPSESTVLPGITLLLKYRGLDFALLKVSEIFEYDNNKLLKLYYETNSDDHPGVRETKKLSGKFITGKLSRIEKLTNILDFTSMEPIEVKEIIKLKKWNKIVGFHTRNPPHRAHEYLQKCSLENADGLLIHPVVGFKKEGDFTRAAIMNSYECYVDKYLPKENVILTPLMTYSRYAGPREAMFTAIVRRNYGCTHFIVGRDHTGVGNFYGKYDAQKIFSNFPDIGIKILCFNEPYYCKGCLQITTPKTCPHDERYIVEISGSIIRKAIVKQSRNADIYIRREVLNELRKLDDKMLVIDDSES